jgi:hypothetical protein
LKGKEMSKNPRLSGSPKTHLELILEGRTDKAISGEEDLIRGAAAVVRHV